MDGDSLTSWTEIQAKYVRVVKLGGAVWVVNINYESWHG